MSMKNLILPSPLQFSSWGNLMVQPDFVWILEQQIKIKEQFFDAEPIPSPEDIFAKLQGDKYYSKIDISKGFGQIPTLIPHKEINTRLHSLLHKVTSN